MRERGHSAFDDQDLATGDVLSLSVQDNDNPAVASAVVEGTTLTLNLLPDQHGTANVTIRATDQAGEFVDSTFQLTVNSV